MKGTLTRAALAAGGMMVTSAVMAGSLALPTAQSLAGQWQVADSERQCQIEFLANEQSETNGYQLVDRQRCLQSVFAAEVARLRSVPCSSSASSGTSSISAFTPRRARLAA